MNERLAKVVVAVCFVSTTAISAVVQAQGADGGTNPPGNKQDMPKPDTPYAQGVRLSTAATSGSTYDEEDGTTGRCKVEDDHKLAHIVFNADGTPHCTLSSVREGYRLEVVVELSGDDTQLPPAGSYSIQITPGTAIPSANVRGSLSDFAVSSNKGTKPTRIARKSGPLESQDVTVAISCSVCGVNTTQKITVAPLYSVNIVGIATYSFSSESTYSVSNGKIAESATENPIHYFVGAKIYPLAWAIDRRIGVYFDKWDWDQLISLEGGLSLETPTERVYAGISVNTPIGLSVGLGWQPFKKQVLQGTYAVGNAYSGTSAPVDKHWQSRFAISLMVDSSVAKSLISIFK